MSGNKRKTAYLALFALFFGLTSSFGHEYPVSALENANAFADTESGYETENGGGFAATGQVQNAGYTAEVYDATSGLPTSDANYILGSSDGYVWIAGYSGIFKFDGSGFERLDTSTGLTNGRGLFEDSLGRIWVGTNDNGVVVIDGNKTTHITYKDGLPSSSMRVFEEDDEGNVYIGTTAGVCYADRDLKIHRLTNDNLVEERVLKLDRDSIGRVYGQTKSGRVFVIENKSVRVAYTSADLEFKKVTAILADPFEAGKLYFADENGYIYHGYFGQKASEMEQISVYPLTNVHWLSYDCGRIWVSTIYEIGYLDENRELHILSDLPFDSGIEMMTSDYQGNMWFASSTQGVMKIVTNSFVNVNNLYSIPGEVTNAVCIHGNMHYIGTDTGLVIIDKNGKRVKNKLTAIIGEARVRCIAEDPDGSMWFAVYTDNIGLVCLTPSGRVIRYTKDNGMPDNEIRCVSIASDGSVLVGTNGGLAVIVDGKVTRTVTAADGIKNTVFLSVVEGKNGDIIVGTDGDGIYILEPDGNIRSFTRDDGLTSDVVMRIKNDAVRGVYWAVTSNSIEYFKNGVITNVSSFPYNNNYDLFFDDSDDMWIVSSYGLYAVSADEMVKDRVSGYRLYTVRNGLTSTPTSNSYGVLTSSGNLYIPGRSGVCRINVNDFSDNRIPVKVTVGSIYVDDEKIMPEDDGSYTISSTSGRIKITASVLDYSYLNPLVYVYMEGKEEEGIKALKSDLPSLEYTGLAYGTYILHISVFDSSGNTQLLNESFKIVKKPRLMEMVSVRIFMTIFVFVVGGFAAWRFMKSTIIRKQYDEIRQARDDAERANTAKSRFLANMSHEIRTPINTIMGMNEMVMREDPTGVPKNYFLSMMNYSLDIRNATESLLSLINDLLDMSKIESGKMHLVEQEYDIADMLRSVVSMIRVRSNDKELTFDVVIDEILPKRLYGDVGKIKQIILNLLTNAVKYTEKGGFALLVSMDERDNDACVLRFSVKDTGIGVKEEDLDKLFTAYERLDEERNSGIQGTGLGLDISRRFAELMGGTLRCESVYGKGSEFILTVSQRIVDVSPLGVFIEHEAIDKNGPYVPQFIAPDADILVVDDNPMNLTVIKGLLKGTRVFVTTASSGEECLEKLKDGKFNVVLLDHMMPGMDGVETVREIRKTDPDLPVYALTANATAGEEFYKSKGFNGYLSKPVESLVLEKTIMKHIPEEMMEKPEAYEAEAELTEMPDNMKWIYDTEGIIADEGIKNSGGISNYIFSLNLFLDTMDDNGKVIEDAYNSGNIRLYTIKVHALKSSARIIGAKHLSEYAQKLEDAGNSEDMVYIDANHDLFLKEFYEYKEKLARLKEEKAREDLEPIPESELKDAYEALKDVIPQMDYDSVEMILESLKEYSLPSEDEKKIKELGRLLKLFDWDKMEEVVNSNM